MGAYEIVGVILGIIGALGLGIYLRRAIRVILLHLKEFVKSKVVPILAGAKGKLARGVLISFLVAFLGGISYVIYILIPEKIHEVSFNMVGTYATSREINRIFVVGNTTYLANREDGLLILDVSVPAQPRKIAQYKGENAVHNVVVDRDIAYVTQGTKLVLLDVSLPSVPRKIGEYEGEGSLGGELDVAGDTVYAVGSEKLILIDVSRPSSPQRIGEFNFGRSSLVSCDVDVVGNIAFIAGGTGGVHIVDVRTPSNPICIGRFDTGGWAAKISVNNNIAYVTMWREGLSTLDVSQPSRPTKLGYYRPELRKPMGQDLLIDLSVVGDTAWVTYFTGVDFTQTGYSRIGSGVVALNVKNPSSPLKISEFHMLEQAMDVFATDGLLYVADRTSLYIFKVARD